MARRKSKPKGPADFMGHPAGYVGYSKAGSAKSLAELIEAAGSGPHSVVIVDEVELGADFQAALDRRWAALAEGIDRAEHRSEQREDANLSNKVRRATGLNARVVSAGAVKKLNVRPGQSHIQ